MLVKRCTTFSLILAAWMFGPVRFGHSDSAPLFDSSSDTVFDIILEQDPSSFLCAKFSGTSVELLWDKRINDERNTSVFRFEAFFGNLPAPITFFVNKEIADISKAEAEVLRLATAFGRLPVVVQRKVEQIGIHGGTPTFSAGPHKIFVYTDRIQLRIAQNRLEESLFHEAVHASLDLKHATSASWREAQSADPGFISDYAHAYPQREDLAETALFAYAIFRHPSRLPPVDTEDIKRQVPNRLALLREILEADSNFGHDDEAVEQNWKGRCEE